MLAHRIKLAVESFIEALDCEGSETPAFSVEFQDVPEKRELVRQRGEILGVLDRALTEADEMHSEGFPLADWAEDARALFGKYRKEN